MAPLGIGLVSNIALDDTATDDDTSTVGEPSVGAAGRQLFVTGNWYASRSIDSGGSWTHVDPFTALPSAAGGFCCDQLTLHDDARGVWIWILQYSQQNGTNVFRLAATLDANFPTGGWYWWDISPQTLDANWTNVWFDYPDAAITADNLFITFNVFDTADNWQRAVVMRFPLATIANAGILIFNSWSTTENGSLRLTQGAQQTMYWGSHNSNQQLRLFSWRDGQNTINWWDIGVAEWAREISSTAPNGVDWLERADPRITGASVGGGLISFMWTAGSRQNRPHAYCRAVRISETPRQVFDEPDIFSTQRAWAYPALSPNNNAVLGLTAFYGGAGRHPGHVVGARDDGASTWRTRYSQLGSDSPSAGSWGDYLTCRTHGSSPETWIASGYTLEGGEAREDILPRVVHFNLGVFQDFILQTGTALEEAQDVFDFALGDWNKDGTLDLFAIKKRATGSNSTEVHVLSGASGFQDFILQTGTALEEAQDVFDFALGDWNKDGTLDLFAIKKRATGSNSTEVHVLSGASGFQDFILQTGTALEEAQDVFDFALGDWNKDGTLDLFAIKKRATGSNSTEVHVLSGASGFQDFILQTGTALEEAQDVFDFALGDWNKDGTLDLFAIKKRATGSNSTEVHVLSGASGFQDFILQTGTALEEAQDVFDFALGDWNKDGTLDLFAIKKRATGSNSTEVHVLSG